MALLVDLDDEIRPALPPRRLASPESHSSVTSTPRGDLAAIIKKEPRPPPVPRKPQRLSVSGLKIVDNDDEENERRNNRITLIDLDDVSDTERDTVSVLSNHHTSTPSLITTDGAYESTKPQQSISSAPNPAEAPSDSLGGITQAFGKFRTAVSIQNGTNAFWKMSQNAQKTLNSIAQGTGELFNETGTAVKATIRDANQGNVFLERTTDDITDLANRTRGQPGICSKCNSLPLELCFTTSPQAPDSIREAFNYEWISPLSRILYHASWCRICQLLLSMLCRSENDPLQHSDVAPFIAQPWLRGLSMQRWIDEGWAEADNSWPFGYSEDRYEGSTNVVGQISETLSRAAPIASRVAMKVMMRSAIRGQASGVQSRDFRRRESTVRADAVRQERERLQKYPLPVVLVIEAADQKSGTPGLLAAQIIGVKPSLDGETERCFSRFVVQAIENRFVFDLKAERPLFYGQVLDPHRVDLHIAKLWLAECEHGHGRLCSEHGWALSLERPTFLRVIDVDELCVKEIEDPASCRYIALSYVWGQADMLKLRNHNRRNLMEPRGLQSYLTTMPRTILDAMEVVKAIGERYLWADALSILQEDTEESLEHIGHMDRVYGSALFTIVAANGTDANSVLGGIWPRHFECPSQPWSRTFVQPHASFKEDLDVIAPFPSNQNLDTALWSSRAWTFQEQMLSRRLLVFANNEMTWHCRTRIRREGMSHEPAIYAPKPLKWLSLKPRHFGVSTSDEHWTDGSIEVTRHGLTHVVRSDTFAEYAKVIKEYARRKMTYASDAINALSGLLRIFALCFQSECIFGLPAALLDVALLWRPLGPLERRHGFPSWSWAGWSGEIRYDDPVRIKRDDSGQTIEVEGIRPLIRWHTFEAMRGTLLPINGTGRGLPLNIGSVPREWEAHPPRPGCSDLTHTCQEPDLFDLPAAAISNLSSQCLIFWASCSHIIQLGSQLSPTAPQVWPEHGDGITHILWDKRSNRIGHVQIDDGGRTGGLVRQGFKIMLLSETLYPTGHPNRFEGAYAYHQFMAVQYDDVSGISSRIGLGVVEKKAWRDLVPQLELICLG